MEEGGIKREEHTLSVVFNVDGIRLILHNGDTIVHEHNIVDANGNKRREKCRFKKLRAIVSNTYPVPSGELRCIGQGRPLEPGENAQCHFMVKSQK